MTQENKDKQRLNRLRIQYKAKGMYLESANHLLDRFDMFGISEEGFTKYQYELLTKMEGDMREMSGVYKGAVIEELSSHDEY